MLKKITKISIQTLLIIGWLLFVPVFLFTLIPIFLALSYEDSKVFFIGILPLVTMISFTVSSIRKKSKKLAILVLLTPFIFGIVIFLWTVLII
jgi:hypothetical protein